MFKMLMEKMFGPSEAELAQQAAIEAERLEKIRKIFIEDLQIIFTQAEGPHWGEITGKWYHFDFARGALLRECQIFISCHRLACNSFNRETAQSNSEQAMKIWNSGFDRRPPLKVSLGKYIPGEMVSDLDKDANAQFEEFSWKIPMHEAEGYLKKAEKLKTAKGRAKYLNEAARLLKISCQFDGFDVEQVKALEQRAAALA